MSGPHTLSCCYNNSYLHLPVVSYFRKCREYLQAYHDSKSGGNDVEDAVKLYMSHYRVFGKVD